MTPRSIVIATLVVLGLCWVFFGMGSKPEASSGDVRPPKPRAVRAEPAPPVPAREQTRVAAYDALVPKDPEETALQEPEHPHPITPAHLRIFRENNLIGALNGAMDVKDPHGMRRLLAQYRSEYPEDPHGLQEGYEIVADCLGNPGEASAAAAQKYYDTKTASSLRRYVRRHCFEKRP
jgi:hypothetical protein